jgi:hypothetical protein
MTEREVRKCVKGVSPREAGANRMQEGVESRWVLARWCVPKYARDRERVGIHRVQGRRSRSREAECKDMHCSKLHFQTDGRAAEPWTSRVQIHEWRRRPGRVKDRGTGAGEARASRKQAPKTMRVSETRALRAIRSRATLVARAAPRRAANAGQVRLIASESDSRVRTDWMENKRAGSVGSP